jgi:response regulator RpfG family c-di-GMP phosphodiesterase
MTKVLLVEDNPDLRSLLLVQIKLMGFTPITASTGKEALEAATCEKPDLILMDFLMPGMDGWEATRMLRLNPETKDIPSSPQPHCRDPLIFNRASRRAATTTSSSHFLWTSSLTRLGSR